MTLTGLCVWPKAAYLVYEDREYVNDIIRLWQSEKHRQPLEKDV